MNDGSIDSEVALGWRLLAGRDAPHDVHEGMSLVSRAVERGHPGAMAIYDGEHSYGRDGTYKGDRLATLLMYLNDDYDGGVLQFVRVGYTYRGKTGDALFFASLREGKRDEKAEHGATTVTRGEKFILSQWIHDRPFTA